MKIVSSAPAGVAFGADDYHKDGNNFVLFWNRYTKKFSAGLNSAGSTLSEVTNPEYLSAQTYPEAKQKAERFFATASVSSR